MLTTLLFALEIKFVLKIESNAWGMTQEVGRNTRLRLVFLPTLLSCSSCFLRALQQNRAQSKASLYLLSKNLVFF